jgi:hypothetical protein
MYFVYENEDKVMKFIEIVLRWGEGKMWEKNGERE